jgi:hypothetical protein
MENKAQRGYLVLADISGFTAYMAATELEHSQDIMADLLETIICKLTPTLTLSKLEGDAVFVYAPQARLARGETVVELLENTYLAFRDRVTSIKHRTTCTCDACRALPTLDLKFFVHCGDYFLQRVMDKQEVVGSDVNLVHRLMKNGVSEATGWRAYVLYSAAALQQVGLSAEGLAALTESYEHLGDVQTYASDMAARYQEIVEARRVMVTREDADAVASFDFAAPPVVVWEWLNDPALRSQISQGPNWTVLQRSGGRTKPGARNHCAHGKHQHIETIQDWRPFEYVTSRTCPPSGKGMTMTTTHKLTQTESGTHLDNYIQITGVPRFVVKLFLGRMVARIYGKVYRELDAKLHELASSEQAEAEPSAVLVPQS